MVEWRSNFHKKVNFVLLLIDSYTNEVIKNSVSVSAYSGLYRPIKKEDGYFVFVNMEIKDILQVDIKSEIYEQEYIILDTSSINAARPVIKYKLTPKIKYLPKDTTIISGKSKLRNKVSFIYEKSMNIYKLLYDIKKGQEFINIYNPSNEDLEGEEFAVANKKGDILEIIKLDMKNEAGDYTTMLPLKKNYKKSEHSLIRITTIMADDNGEYVYPIKSFDERCKTVKLIMNGDIETLITIELEKGAINFVNSTLC